MGADRGIGVRSFQSGRPCARVLRVSSDETATSPALRALRRSEGEVMGEQEAKFSEWVVLELMGHRKLAGLLTEQEIAGHGFLRLEVPGAPEEPPWHKLREDELADGHECG